MEQSPVLCVIVYVLFFLCLIITCCCGGKPKNEDSAEGDDPSQSLLSSTNPQAKQQERERIREQVLQQERERLERQRQRQEYDKSKASATTRSEYRPAKVSTLPSAPNSQLQQLLVDLDLTQYERALASLGYDHIDCFDMFNQQNCMDELVEQVKMKKPHARKLIKALSAMHNELMNTTSGTGVDHLNLPVATVDNFFDYLNDQ